MNYDGIEIDMLCIGDADSILVTRWVPGRRPMRVLIDGGTAESAETVLSFLANQAIGTIDHLVCTHPHDDHALGLVTIASQSWLGIGCAWMHRPQSHLDLGRLLSIRSLSSQNRIAREIQKSLETVDELTGVLARRGVPMFEPFAGTQIGFLTVVGPSVEYYRQLVGEFADVNTRAAFERVVEQTRQNETLLELLQIGSSDGSLLENPQTSAENQSSAILATVVGDRKYLFTADAGAEALARALQAYPQLAGLHWMQIPHHGSRRNITAGLIDHLRPNVAFVSACGNAKHPRRAVVNAFKRVGTLVYSTHYPAAEHLYHHSGLVPAREGYGPAYPLWNAPASICA